MSRSGEEGYICHERKARLIVVILSRLTVFVPAESESAKAVL